MDLRRDHTRLLAGMPGLLPPSLRDDPRVEIRRSGGNRGDILGSSEGVGKRLRNYGVPHVVCWRSEVRDVTAMRFSATFYTALDCQSDGVRDYKRAFEQAAQPARMRSSEPTSSQARKPAKHQAPGAVDFICLLSKDGNVFPEPPKEETQRLQGAAARGAAVSVSAELIYPTMSGASSVENAREDAPIGEKCANAGPNKIESESSILSPDSLECAVEDELIG